MIIVVLTSLNPISIGTIEVQDKEEAFDLYSLNPNYIIAFIDTDEVMILGSVIHKESLYAILKEHGYIFDGKKVSYLPDNVRQKKVS